jgi:hypothetical protein
MQLVIYATFAFLFGGSAKIAEGFRKKELKTWQRVVSFGVVGALTVAVANTIFVVTGFWNRYNLCNIRNCPNQNRHSDDIHRTTKNQKIPKFASP